MKHLSLISLIGAASISFAEPPINESVKDEYQVLIESLSSDSFSERESAMATLWAAGNACIEQLRHAKISDDPERSKRLEVLIRNIESGILPDTDPKVISAVEKYRHTTSADVKARALDTLIKERAYKQALHLLHLEGDIKVKKALASNSKMRSIAVYAAREAISKGDINEAIALLRIAPQTQFSYRALAHLLKSRGHLDKEIEDHVISDEESIMRHLTFLRVQGDLDSIKEFATKHDLKDVLVSVSLMEGESKQLLDHLITRSEDETHRHILNILSDFQENNDVQLLHKRLLELESQIEGDTDNEDYIEYLLRASMLLGDRKVGERLLQRCDKEASIIYYNKQVNSQKELAMYGVPHPVNDADEFGKWLEEEVAKELDVDLGHLDSQESTIEALAWFYSSRGELEVALRILTPLITELEANGDDRWFELLAMLGLQGMCEEMVVFASVREDVDDVYNEITQSLLGDSAEILLLQKEIATLYPEQKSELRFISLLVLAGVCESDDVSIKLLESSLYERAEKSDKSRRLEILAALAYIAESRGDLLRMLNYNKELCENVEYGIERGFLQKYQAAAAAQFDWKEVVASYDLAPEIYKKSISKQAFYAIAKIKLGDVAEGKKLLDVAILQTLGVTKNVNEVASILHQSGFEKEAQELWLDNLLTLDVSWDLYNTISNINKVSKIHIRQKNWKLADAFLLAEKAVYLDPGVRFTESHASLRDGFMSTFVHGLALYKGGQREEGIKILKFAHDALIGDGTLADDFYPNLLDSGLKDEVNAWFEASWQHYKNELDQYPKNHNAHNTRAWLGCRAVRRLDEAKQHVETALKLQPEQPAYLDTLAETHFAMRDRKSAIKFSDSALQSIREGRYGYSRGVRRARGLYSDLLHQNRRFRNSDFPVSQ